MLACPKVPALIYDIERRSIVYNTASDMMRRATLVFASIYVTSFDFCSFCLFFFERRWLMAIFLRFHDGQRYDTSIFTRCAGTNFLYYSFEKYRRDTRQHSADFMPVIWKNFCHLPRH